MSAGYNNNNNNNNFIEIATGSTKVPWTEMSTADGLNKLVDPIYIPATIKICNPEHIKKFHADTLYDHWITRQKAGNIPLLFRLTEEMLAERSKKKERKTKTKAKKDAYVEVETENPGNPSEEQTVNREQSKPKKRKKEGDGERRKKKRKGDNGEPAGEDGDGEGKGDSKDKEKMPEVPVRVIKFLLYKN